MKLILFGGSFDPIHQGHISLAAQALFHSQSHQVLFLPAGKNPLKPQGPIADNDTRLRWINQSIAGIPWAKSCRFDLDTPPPCYSWKTVTWAQKQYPKASLHWLIGADQWQQLDQWDKINWLDQQLTWIVAPRAPSSSLTPPPLPPPSKPQRKALFLPLFQHPASSTAIRNCLRSKKTPPLNWLPWLLKADLQTHNPYANRVDATFRK